MKKTILISLFLLSCTSPHARTPQSTADLLSDLQNMKADIEGKNLDANTCHGYLQSKLNSLKEERIQEYSGDQAKSVSESVMLATWQVRLALHQRLDQISSCRTELRQVFYQLRAIEDLAGLKFYNVPQTNLAELGDMQKQPIPLIDNDFYHGYLGSSGQIEMKPAELHPGDLMVTRGGSFFSAVLSSIMTYPGQLDHFVLISQDPETKKLNSIESYAQNNGVSRFDINFALKNENPRLFLLRPKDAAVGIRASEIMMEKVLAGEKDPKKQIGYDYVMDLSSENKMTCSAVTYWGYKDASNGQFVIPEERSQLLPNLTQIYKQTGIQSTPMLTAQDMELDSRFDLLLEFRDQRLIEDSRLREVVAQSIFKWMNNDGYKIKTTLKVLAIEDIIYPLHRTPLGPFIAKITKSSIPNGAPKGFITTLSELNDISDLLYKVAYDANKSFVEKTGWSMTHNQLMAALETYRQEDLNNCLNHSRATKLHHLYAPKHCQAEKIN